MKHRYVFGDFQLLLLKVDFEPKKSPETGINLDYTDDTICRKYEKKCLLMSIWQRKTRFIYIKHKKSSKLMIWMLLLQILRYCLWIVCFWHTVPQKVLLNSTFGSKFEVCWEGYPWVARWFFAIRSHFRRQFDILFCYKCIYLYWKLGLYPRSWTCVGFLTGWVYKKATSTLRKLQQRWIPMNWFVFVDMSLFFHQKSFS